MVYNVLDICRFVINYSNEKEYGVSNLKLQKLLYFIQAFFLITANKKCFSQRIEAWEFGPVVPEAYREYKCFGAADIPPIIYYYVIEGEALKKLKYNENTIKEYDRNLVSEVIEEFKDYSATDLVRLTHGQDPWKDAYQPYENNVITEDALRRYFNE